mgnify:CR=1 FL=1
METAELRERLEKIEEKLEKIESSLHQDPPDEVSGLMTLQEAAKYLRITEGTLRNWCYDRKVKYLKVGSYNRFRKEDLDAVCTRAAG